MINIAPTIYASSNPHNSLKELLETLEFSTLAVIVDENTSEHCLPIVEEALEDFITIKINSGELNKNLETCIQVWQQLTKANFDRNAFILNIGGGVIGDLGGFCAATYKRGIRFGNVPTTLLSQVDASVGGKLGIDFNNYKNQIGVFCEPEFVLICTEFLKTLPSNELLSGYAEVVKHSLIADATLWEDLKKGSINDMMAIEPVSRAVKIKWDIVQQDFNEKAERKLLNFGHTMGHAVESYLLTQNKRKILHGEAVAAGMLMEAWLSREKGLLSSDDFEDIERYLLDTFPFINISVHEIEGIAGYLIQDKKNISGKLMFTLLAAIGKGVFDQNVTNNECINAFEYYINLKE